MQVFHCKAWAAVVDCCTVGTTWKLFSFLWNARDLSSKSGMWRQIKSRCLKLFSPQVLNLVSSLLNYKMPGGCARWSMESCVFVNEQTSWTKNLQELEYIYPFCPPSPPFWCPPIVNTPWVLRTLTTSRDLHKTTPLDPKHIRYPTQHCTFPLGVLPPKSTVS